VQIKKNGEAFGVRLSWQPLSPTLLFLKLKGKAAPVPQHSRISLNFLVLIYAHTSVICLFFEKFRIHTPNP
jgi:hypothetical protein